MKPAVSKFTDIGRQPYDATLTPDGRYYIAGLFGEDGLALLDLWDPEQGCGASCRLRTGSSRCRSTRCRTSTAGRWPATRLRPRRRRPPGAGDRHRHLEGDRAARGRGSAGIRHGAPGRRQVWVNFALPDNDTVQVIDTHDRQIIQTLNPGKAVLHMEFTPARREVWVSVRDDDRVDVYDTGTFAKRDAAGGDSRAASSSPSAHTASDCDFFSFVGSG